MDLFYDERDAPYHEACGSQILYWLDDLGAKPFTEAGSMDQGFLFAGFRSHEDYRQLVASYPLIHDRPEDQSRGGIQGRCPAAARRGAPFTRGCGRRAVVSGQTRSCLRCARPAFALGSMVNPEAKASLHTRTQKRTLSRVGHRWHKYDFNVIHA
jgi:hypothetical protein